MEDQSEQPLGVRGQSLSDMAMLFHEVSVWSIVSTPKMWKNHLSYLIILSLFSYYFYCSVVIFCFYINFYLFGVAMYSDPARTTSPKGDGPLGTPRGRANVAPRFELVFMMKMYWQAPGFFRHLLIALIAINFC